MSDIPSIPVEQPTLPRLGKAFAVLVLAMLVIVGGWQGFRFAKLHLALAHAHREFSTAQFMRADFWAARALSVDEKNIEATRLMAEINEAQDRPAALAWRIKVAQLNPENATDKMAWAKSALRFGQSEMAASALETLPSDFKNRSAEYQELMAGRALAANEMTLAESYFLKAVELDRQNPVHQVNLAAFRLTISRNRELRADASRELEGSMADPRVRLFATRTLLVDALRNGDRARAGRFAEKLRSLPEHNFTDDLSCLHAVMSDPAFHPALDDIERRAESDPLLATQMGEWLNAHGMASEALRWFSRLPQPTQSNVRVQMAAAEAYSATYDWDGLGAFLAKCQWDDGEFSRRAMLIRCKRELAQPWEKDWKQLVSAVAASPTDGLLLAQVVIGWKWREEALSLLWGVATNPKAGSKALQSLWELYSQASDTRNLLRVAKAQIDLDPTNPGKKNNVAFLSLLLSGASERSERLAREASATDPNVPEWKATYAYALHLAGKNAAAKETMNTVAPEALGRPGVALYSAIVLAANGDDARARHSFAKLNPNGMLPEERKLAADLAQKLSAGVR